MAFPKNSAKWVNPTIRVAGAAVGATLGGPLGGMIGGFLAPHLGPAISSMLPHLSEQFGAKAGQKLLEIGADSATKMNAVDRQRFPHLFREVLKHALIDLHTEEAFQPYDRWFKKWFTALKESDFSFLPNHAPRSVTAKTLSSMFVSDLGLLAARGEALRSPVERIVLEGLTLDPPLVNLLLTELPPRLLFWWDICITSSEYEGIWKEFLVSFVRLLTESAERSEILLNRLVKNTDPIPMLHKEISHLSEVVRAHVDSTDRARRPLIQRIHDYLTATMKEIDLGNEIDLPYIEPSVSDRLGHISLAQTAIREWLAIPQPTVALVLAGAGAGKTALALHTFKTVALRFLQMQSTYYPVYIDLGRCRTSATVDDVVDAFLRRFDLTIGELKSSGQITSAVLIFDSLDELSAPSRLAAAQDSKFLVATCRSGCKVLVLSRSNHFRSEKEPSLLFADTPTLDDILGNRTLHAPREWFVAPLSADQIDQYLRMAGGSDLIPCVRGNTCLADLAQRPLLLKMIVASASSWHAIDGPHPLKVTQLVLYSEFFKKWIATEQVIKKRPSDETLIRRFCQRVAAYMHTHYAGQLEEASLRNIMADIAPPHLDLFETLPVAILAGFLRRSGDAWRFAHYSFYEYFLACETMDQLRSNSPWTLLPERSFSPGTIGFCAEAIYIDEDVIRLHQGLQRSETPSVRRNIGAILRCCHDLQQQPVEHTRTSVLPRDLSTRGPEELWGLLAVSGWRGNSKDRLRIRRFLRTGKDESLARIGLLALGFFSDPRDVPLIRSVYEQFCAAPMVGGAAVFAVAFIPGDAARRFAAYCFRTSDHLIVRRAAAWSIEVARDESAVGLLLEGISGDEEDEVVLYAVSALGVLRAYQAQPALESVVFGKRTAAVRIAALTSLLQMNVPTIRQIVEKMDKTNQDPAIKSAIDEFKRSMGEASEEML